MTDLLKSTRVPDENQAKMTKIQLKDVAKIWWLAEAARLEKLITWDQFSKDFYAVSYTHLTLPTIYSV